MPVAYIVQTYHMADLAHRLVRTLRAGSPDAVIVVSHDRDSPEPPHPRVEDHADAVLHGPGGRGDFATVERLLDFFDWMERTGTAADWVVNLTGQDYPVRPVHEIERQLKDARADAFLEFFPVFDPYCRWGPREGRSRYSFEYRWLRPQLTQSQRRLLRPFMAVNRIQPFFRISTAYGLAVGRRCSNQPFDRDRACYGGSFYGALSARSIELLREEMNQNPGLEQHFRHSLVPEEAYLQTLLVNRSELAIRNSSQRYYDFRGSIAGSPKVLTIDDLPRILASDAWFARKFDTSVDSEVLDRLDETIGVHA